MNLLQNPYNFTHLTLGMLLQYLGKFRTEENVETVNDLVLSQPDKPQTHRTVSEIPRETGIHRSSVSRIICKDLRLKCLKRRRAQELTDANCAARMKRAKLLLKKFPQSATDSVFFTDENVFSVASPDNWQNKVSDRLRELLKKKLSVFFSAGTARSAAAWPPVNCACVPRLSEQLIKHHALYSFSQEINLSTPLLCTSSNTNFFYQNLVLVAEYHVDCWQTLQ